MRRSLIVDTTARLLFHSALVLSLYLLFAGHNQPGGGFVGALVAGAAFAIHYVAGGSEQVQWALRVPPAALLGTGLVVAAGAAVAPLLGGGAVLEGGFHELDVAVLGKVKVTSALVFDTGVYLVVLGLVTMLFEAFGQEPSTEEAP